MYICVCNALTDGDVRSAEAAGAATQGQVFRHYGVKMQCGRCANAMRSTLGGPSALGQAALAGERRHADDAQPTIGHSRRAER